MSSLIVDICEVVSVEAHPDPEIERLEVVTVKNWKTCAPIGTFKAGEKCVFIPPDAVVLTELSDLLGVTKYLAELPKDNDGNRPADRRRVRAIRLRGQPSFGLIFKPSIVDLDDTPVGTNVAEQLGIEKWEPPIKDTAGVAERPHPLFHTYTNIENWGNFPDLLTDGEEVVITEKIHGTNCRAGIVVDDEEGTITVAGSHNQRRKEVDDKGKTSMYWMPLAHEGVKSMLDAFIADGAKSAILFCEIFGSGVQTMTYGYENGAKAFRAFDIAIDTVYLGVDEKDELFKRYDIPHVPFLFRGPYNQAVVEGHTSGDPIAIGGRGSLGKFKGREGIVITPVVERTNLLTGRVILKSISADYFGAKGVSDSH